MFTELLEIIYSALFEQKLLHERKIRLSISNI